MNVCTELFYCLSLLPYNTISKSNGALPTTQQQPNFLLKENSSSHNFFPWTSLLVYLTVKWKIHTMNNMISWDWPCCISDHLSYLCPSHLRSSHLVLGSSLNISRMFSFQGVGRYLFSLSGNSSSQGTKVFLLFILKNIFKSYPFRKIYPRSTFKKKNMEPVWLIGWT